MIRRFSDSTPDNIVIKTLPAQEVLLGTRRFINENLRGLVEFKAKEAAHGFINVSVRGLAYMLRVMLEQIYAREILTVKIIASYDSLKITFTGAEGLYNSKTAMKLAENAGFPITKIEDGVLIIETPTRLTKELTVYANTNRRVTREFYEVFFQPIYE